MCPTPQQVPAGLMSPRRSRWRDRRRSINAMVDNFVFAFSGLAALWLAWLVLSQGFAWGWYLAPFFVVFWLVLAYLVLPRLHSILTSIYVPDYFIGRARTSDGLLGDPINLAVMGSEAQLHEAMTRAGWIRADEITLASSRRIITSTILKRSYDEAPVSPLLLFGHQQDLAYQQEVQGNPAKRHHVRFWRCPDGWMLPGGHRADWLAAGTFDRAVGFSLFTLQVTHKIDADTDIERDHIVSTLVESGAEIQVRVIEDFATGYHSRNGGGDTIQTDGDLPVVDVRPVAVPLDGNALGPGLDARREIRARRRPVSTALGVLLMVVRVVVGAVTVVLMLGEWQEVSRSAVAGMSAEEAQMLDVFVLVVVILAALGIALYLVLAVLVFRGSNWARIASMAYSGLLVVASAVSILGGEHITLGTNLFGLPLDILVLLALSARSSRLWARRPSARKRTGSRNKAEPRTQTAAAQAGQQAGAGTDPVAGAGADAN